MPTGSIFRNKKAFTLAELMVAAALGILIVAATVHFYFSTNNTYSSSVSRQQYQDFAHVILSKIIDGQSLVGGAHLSEAVSYNIVSLSELHFTDINGVERAFYLNNAATSLMFNPDVNSPNSAIQTVFTAPSGTLITLRFSHLYTGEVVGIDAAISRVVSGATIAGSASTFVTIRNHGL